MKRLLLILLFFFVSLGLFAQISEEAIQVDSLKTQEPTAYLFVDIINDLRITNENN